MLDSVETLVMEGTAAGRSPASGAAPGQAISPAEPGHPHAFSSGPDEGIAAWHGKSKRPSGRCLDMGWDTSLAPHIPLRIPPFHFYFAFQGQRSCYSCLYQSSFSERIRFAWQDPLTQTRWPVLMALCQLIS